MIDLGSTSYQIGERVEGYNKSEDKIKISQNVLNVLKRRNVSISRKRKTNVKIDTEKRDF